MEPTPKTPAAGEAFVEAVRTRRPAAAGVLLAVAAACLGLTVWMAVKSFAGGPAPADPPPATELNLPKPEEVLNPNRPAFMVGGILALAGTLLLGAAGAWLLAAVPHPDPARERADIRLVLLAGFGMLGAVLIVGGLIYFYLWTDHLTAWLNRGETKRAVYPVSALLMVAAGAAVVLLGIAPARADERENPTVRRVVYGANLGLTSLLLLTFLVIGNVFAALKLSNRLDVTAAGLSALSDPTAHFLQNMPQPVKVVQIATDGEGPEEARRQAEVRRLLDRMAEASVGKLTVRTLNPNITRQEFMSLAKKYPPVERETFGVLLTAENDEKRFRFVPLDDMFGPAAGGGRGQVFKGEAELSQAMSALIEGDRKSVVYFTQGAGELQVSAGPPAPPDQSGGVFKAYLEKNLLEVRPLALDPFDPKIPADAAMVVVANPTAPLDPKAVAAVRKYMTDPGPDNRAGRLMVLAGANPFPPENKVAPTGLEPLLQEMGVALGSEFLLSVPIDNLNINPLQMIVVPTAEARNSNPVAQLFARGAGPWAYCRTVTAAPSPPGGGSAFRASPLFVTAPRERATWLEPTVPADLDRALNELAGSKAVQTQKQVAGSRPVAAAVLQGTTPRAVVFGAGEMASDAATRTRGGQTHPNLELLGATVDWLRDRPAVAPGVVNKDMPDYRMNPNTDDTRLVVLPIVLVLLTVGGMGIGVWVVRRK